MREERQRYALGEDGGQFALTMDALGRRGLRCARHVCFSSYALGGRELHFPALTASLVLKVASFPGLVPTLVFISFLTHNGPENALPWRCSRIFSLASRTTSPTRVFVLQPDRGPGPMPLRQPTRDILCRPRTARERRKPGQQSFQSV